MALGWLARLLVFGGTIGCAVASKSVMPMINLRNNGASRKGIGVALFCALGAGAAELPVQHVVIYKNGVALFERAGTVPAGQAAHLEFRTSEMNDILKSLTIVDSAGHKVNSVRYDSNETLAQRLRDFSFTLGSGELLSQLLDKFKGAVVELKTGDKTLSGSIAGARAISSGENGKPVQREQVTLLTSSGELVTVDLGAIASLQFQSPDLQSQLKRYLQTLDESRSREKRNVYIDATGSGQQDLKVSYVTPVPIWKSSYRLTLNDAKSTIEGWAIVDNTTDEDWNGVRLSVVSGRPVSFISQLDTPRYGKRTVAELPEDTAAGPVVYGGDVGDAPSAGIPQSINGITEPAPARANQKMAGDAYRLKAAPAPPPPPAQELSSVASTVQVVNAEPVGELFEYSFGHPITLKRNQSAMIPFVQDPIATRKLLIFDNSGSEHPVNAAEITNTTSKTLDGGPLTVYDQGAYAGEALVETVKAGDKRLIGYAVDYGTRITTAFDTGEETVREVHGGEGVLRLKYASRQTQTYTIRNVDPKPKTLVLQQEGVSEYNILSPKPSERTATAYRFELALAANQSRTFKVEQEHVYDNEVQITTATPDFLLNLTQNKQLSALGRKQLQALVDLKRQATEVAAELQSTQSQINEISTDQGRLRQNIDSLNRVSGQEALVRQYSAQLGGNETQLAQLRDTQKRVAQRKAALEADIRRAVGELQF